MKSTRTQRKLRLSVTAAVAAINPAEKRGAQCFMVITVRNGQWERVHPQGSGYACP